MQRYWNNDKNKKGTIRKISSTLNSGENSRNRLNTIIGHYKFYDFIAIFQISVKHILSLF